MKRSSFFFSAIFCLLFFGSCSKDSDTTITQSSPGNILRVEYLKYVIKNNDTVFVNGPRANINDQDSYEFLKETLLKVTVTGRIWNLPYTGGRLDFYDYGGTEKLFTVSTGDILQSKFQTITTSDEAINGTLYSIDFSFVIPKTVSNRIYKPRAVVFSGNYSSEYVLPVRFDIH